MEMNYLRNGKSGKLHIKSFHDFMVIGQYNIPVTPILTWINFLSQHKQVITCPEGVGWNNSSIPKLQRLHRWRLLMDK